MNRWIYSDAVAVKSLRWVDTLCHLAAGRHGRPYMAPTTLLAPRKGPGATLGHRRTNVGGHWWPWTTGPRRPGFRPSRCASSFRQSTPLPPARQTSTAGMKPRRASGRQSRPTRDPCTGPAMVEGWPRVLTGHQQRCGRPVGPPGAPCCEWTQCVHSA